MFANGVLNSMRPSACNSMVNQEQEQVIAELIALGPISLFPKGVPGGFEIKTAREVSVPEEQWVELEVVLTLHGQPPQDAVVCIYQAFSFSGGLTPALDKKWRRWVRPESWTRAEITTVEGDKTWVLGRKNPDGTSGSAFTPGGPEPKETKEGRPVDLHQNL